MAITQQSYLNDSSSVKAARKKLTAAKAALSDAKKAKEGLAYAPGNKQLAAQIDKRIADAQKALESVTAEVAAVETKVKNYFDKNKDAILAKAAEKNAAKEASAIQALKDQIAAMKKAGLDTTVLENRLASNQKNKTQTPAAESGQETPGTPQAQPEDFANLLTTAKDFIKNMSGADRKFLAKQLNDSMGLKLVVSEAVDPSSLLAAYKGAIAGAQARYKEFGDVLSVKDFLTASKLQVDAAKAAGGTGAGPSTWGQIYDASQAKSAISGIITDLLGREATDAEIASITKKLTKAQADNPFKKNAQGMTVGGLNANQFITDLVKAMPEYVKKKESKEGLVASGIEETLRANGLPIIPSQVKAYADRIKNGEDIKVIENDIRTVASHGLPDSVKKLVAAGTNLDTLYAPYKRVMANSLDLNPDTITLDDPTLRMAIGPDKEMSLYDYQKAIRKDNRWKYSQEANDEVSSMINQVKRDFGFMG